MFGEISKGNDSISIMKFDGPPPKNFRELLDKKQKETNLQNSSSNTSHKIEESNKTHISEIPNQEKPKIKFLDSDIPKFNNVIKIQGGI